MSSLLREHLTRPKIREADDIKFPKLPPIPAYRAWKNLVYQGVNAASGRPDDKAMRWAMQSEDQSLSDDFFHTVPKEFRTLSRKLATRLQEIASGELGREITQLTEDWMRGHGHSKGVGSSVPGLVLWRVILTAYATGRQPEAVSNLNDLQKVQKW